MDKKQKRPMAVVGLALVGAILGYILLRWDPVPYALAILSVMSGVLVAVFALVCWKLKPKNQYEETFSSSVGNLAVSFMGGAFLLMGAVIGIMTPNLTTGALVLSGLFVGTALCVLAVAVCRLRGITAPVFVHALPCIFIVVKLINDFKHWSVDPAITDYCFALFAAIATMCALYHIGEFCFNRGRRRITAFWCLVGLVFCTISMAHTGLSNQLLYGGMALWLASNAFQVLED